MLKPVFKNIVDMFIWSSLFYNTSAMYEWHECNKSNINETRVRHKKHGCKKNITILTRIKNFDFDNNTSGSIFLHPYITYMTNRKIIRGEKISLILNSTFPYQSVFANWTAKPYICDSNCYIKLCTKLWLQIPIVTHSNEALFPIKTIL